MKKIFGALLACLISSAAFGQGQIGPGNVWGNTTAAKAPGQDSAITAILDRAFGSTRGSLLERGASGWALFTPSATARVPYLSGGTGADPLFGAFTLPASVTSGGVACFTSTTAQGSSVLLTLNGLLLGGGAGSCPTPMASLGTTTTLLHGNAGGAPTFAAIVSADMNITATNCTNQFVSAISTGGIGTCTTDTLASAQHANQGTTTTVLHGNAAGNPSFGAVALGTDVSGTLPLANGGLGGSQAAATAGQIPIFPGSGGAAIPTTPTASGNGSSDLFYNATVQVDQTWVGAAANCDGSNNPHTGASQVTETYGPDGWRIGCDTGTGRFTGRQVTSASIGNPVPGITNYLQLSVTTADVSSTATNNYHLELTVEGPRVAQLKYGTASAVSLTCQFQFGSSVNGTYSVSAVEGNANSLSQVATFAYAGGGGVLPISFTYTPFTTGTWVLTPGQFSFKLILDLGSGSNFETASTFTPVAGLKLRTAGSAHFIATNGATAYISALQCDPGTALLPFRFKSYTQDLADAQYFYRKSFPKAVQVAQNAGAAGSVGYVAEIAGTTAGGGIQVSWPEMPNIPTVYTFNPLNTNTKWHNNSTPGDSGTPTVFFTGTSGAFILNPQVVGDGVGSLQSIQFVANGRLGGF